jgi:hypothetical protein
MSSGEWFYDRSKRFDKHRVRWHFVRHEIPAGPDGKEPFEIYFRNDDETEFGMVAFKDEKEFPYRDFTALFNKIMNTVPFRNSLLDPATASIWRKKWR